MALVEFYNNKSVKAKINLAASKSESNRALIIKELCQDEFVINNLATADDTKTLLNLLKKVRNGQTELDVGIAGTVMRFLTAYLATQKGQFILTGAQRMKERPIKVLVDALMNMGAEIYYLEKEGFPPLKINGKQLNVNKVIINGSISSQYISAILMIAPTINNDIEIEFDGKITSKPYIDMTINMMRYFGIDVFWNDNSIRVKSKPYKAVDFLVEADWSAASYWYGVAALSCKADITLLGLKKESLQGDAVVADIYRNFGVETSYTKNGIQLKKTTNSQNQKKISYNFSDCPDIAQTVAVTCAALNVETEFSGLETLRIKETDRIFALETELNKLGFNVNSNESNLFINTVDSLECNWKNVSVKTYSDHRMAMAFAPLAILNSIYIENPEVVTKSYPNFWDDLNKVGFNLLDS